MKQGLDLMLPQALLGVLRLLRTVRLDLSPAVEDEAYLVRARVLAGHARPNVGTDRHVELGMVRGPQNHVDLTARRRPGRDDVIHRIHEHRTHSSGVKRALVPLPVYRTARDSHSGCS
jgi:hypothetical protein